MIEGGQIQRVLYITYDGILEPLGQSQVVSYLRGLTDRNIAFTLLSFEKKYSINEESVCRASKDLKNNNIKWARLFYHKTPPVLSTIFDIMQGLFFSMILVRKEKVNIVHARSYVPAFFATFLRKIFKIKFIFDMRGFWADERVEGRVWKRRKVLYFLTKYLERDFLKNADEIIVLTECARQIIRDWGYDAGKVSVIPCCADVDTFKFSDESRNRLRKKYNLDSKFIFVHTGSLEYWYMKEQMLDYFNAAKKIEPGSHFLILTHSKKEMFMKLILDRKFKIHDFTILSVPFNEIPQYLSMADVGIIFITPVFSKLASSPTKFAEYLSCGLPVIINEKIGDLEKHVLESKVGVVVRNFTDMEYYHTFKQLLDMAKDTDLKNRCRELACNKFSLGFGVDNYYEVYLNLKK